ncbi:tryptophan synthase subunit alpha [Persicimonas caeni]|uniref:Tryptophan synthase alpha chain n=1 Tax=Persicimonas caeni TaxID=2292766 RepID=A0A4Y6Q189_PERCE|nr:tryptophan synthase subunit alpha [Persicimonas caeni]QDG54250.1 tryptophan synthase subunit alpha [Persicimonas caeni]QED35471.1 tryptophan synthase subunit alpha [Persicimonas caeni]
MNRYDRMFERLEEAGEGAFIPFVTLGDPTPEVSLEVVSCLVEAGADALELGIPFSDPIADGPTIQRATRRALDAGTTPGTCWELLAEVRKRHPEVPIGLLVYANLVVQGSVEQFYERAAEAGVDSVLVADVPTLEAEAFAKVARSKGVCPVMIATPNASREKLETVARLGAGYTYVVTRSGVTGAEVDADTTRSEVLDTLARLDAPASVVGFGISRPEQVRAALEAAAAGAISGSAVVRRIEEHRGDREAMLEALSRFVSEMKAATRPLA